ncbi:ribosomal protection-like ABC-F family protein [Paenibacillus radicis (ex Gao et al. 2016)]|uniref:ABC-F type ribosomal protection protein n=1 Tax=Paenibacillus radicis (ex Gao et al. 2016) TaxID=1737354 RepID=A0A917GRZ9_9BACL|nr:ABC-F type ribosomal protection protein [Paenibacillus radicis (ex Gao et al. 2016)]GGG55458.1 ABC-F type ribosomal protection protein [Paenibacillus radicis (ex Gao et al. 2016)]
MTLMTMEQVKITIGDRVLGVLAGSWQLERRERVGIVGRNGAGKSTLLAVLAGRLEPDAGTVRRFGTIAELRQAAGAKGDVADSNCIDEYDALDEGKTTLGDEASAKRWKTIGRDEAESHGSGGERTRQQIAQLFASGAEVLIADEPTSHLDEEGVRQLGEAFASYDGGVLFVSHDRQLMDEVCTHIMELDEEMITVYSGNYSDYRREKEAARQRMHFEYEQYAREKGRLERAIIAVRQQSKSMKNKPSRMSYKEANLGKEGARTSNSKVDSKAKALESRLERLDVKHKPRETELPLFDTAVHELCRSKHVLRVERLSVQLSDRSLFDELSVAIRPGMRIALTGPNGAGKTTLLRLIYGQGERIVKAPGCRIGYFRQDLSLLDESKSVLDNVLSTAIYPDTHVRTVLARTLFKGHDVFKEAGQLSGGERVKAALAKLFLGPYNTLLIDEPTNYLDVFAREQLEAALQQYPGTILFAAHDRRLVQAVATHRLTLYGGGEWSFEECGAEDRGMPGARDARQATSSHEEAERIERLMRVERELAETIGRLSMPIRSEAEAAELDRRFHELVEEKRKWTKVQ